jgi:hypothetical protein
VAERPLARQSAITPNGRRCSNSSAAPSKTRTPSPSRIGEPLGDDAGLPDPGLTDHHQCPAGAASDLPHRRPELVELGGATGQTAIWVGVDSSRHRDRLPDRLPVDGPM